MRDRGRVANGAAAEVSEAAGVDAGHRWMEAIAASRRGEHGPAFELFVREAEEAARRDDHARAAIAWRTASDSAAALGRRDEADRHLRLAGKHYLSLAEEPSTGIQTTYDGYVAAARCFLTVGNLELARECVSNAIIVQRAMR